MDKLARKPKPKPFLLGKELKRKDLHRTAEWLARGSRPKPETKALRSLRQGVNQAAGAAPTLRSVLWVRAADRLRLRALEVHHCPQKQSIPASSSRSES